MLCCERTITHQPEINAYSQKQQQHTQMPKTFDLAFLEIAIFLYNNLIYYCSDHSLTTLLLYIAVVTHEKQTSPYNNKYGIKNKTLQSLCSYKRPTQFVLYTVCLSQLCGRFLHWQSRVGRRVDFCL